MRPLLELGRDEVRGALRAGGIAWRDDASNDDRAHARNRVRHDLLPAFRSLHPAADANLFRTAALLAEDDAALDASAAQLLTGADGLATAAVAAAPAAVVRRALRRVAGFPGPRPAAPERAIDALPSPCRHRRVPLGGGRVAERRYDRIVVLGAGREPAQLGSDRAGACRARPPTAERSFAAWSPPRTVRSMPGSAPG